jgi:hypothetical protein
LPWVRGFFNGFNTKHRPVNTYKHIYHLVTRRFIGGLRHHPPITSNIFPERASTDDILRKDVRCEEGKAHNPAVETAGYKMLDVIER